MINPIIECHCVKAQRDNTRCDLRNRIFIIQITILRQGDSPWICFVRSPWDSSNGLTMGVVAVVVTFLNIHLAIPSRS